MKTSYDLYDEMNPSRLTDAAGPVRAPSTSASGTDLARVLLAPTLVERIVPVQADRIFRRPSAAAAEQLDLAVGERRELAVAERHQVEAAERHQVAFAGRREVEAAERREVAVAEQGEVVIAERGEVVVAASSGVAVAERGDVMGGDRSEIAVAARSDIVVAEREDAGVGGRGTAAVVAQETVGSKSATVMVGVGVCVDAPDLRGRIPAPRREARAAAGPPAVAADLATGSAGTAVDTTMVDAAWTLDDLLRVGEAAGDGLADEPAEAGLRAGVDLGERGARPTGGADEGAPAGVTLDDEVPQDGTFEDLIAGGIEVMPGSSGSLRQTVTLFVIAGLMLAATVAVAVIW